MKSNGMALFTSSNMTEGWAGLVFVAALVCMSYTELLQGMCSPTDFLVAMNLSFLSQLP